MSIRDLDHVQEPRLIRCEFIGDLFLALWFQLDTGTYRVGWTAGWGSVLTEVGSKEAAADLWESRFSELMSAL